MMYFTRAPVIHNTGTNRGTYVQGSLEGVDGTEKATFMEVFDSFQHVVAPGKKLTGAQWIAAITKDVGDIAIRRPGSLGFLDVIRKVMLLSTFGDDFVLANPEGSLVWRGTKGDCIDKQYEVADLEADDLEKWQTTQTKDIELGLVNDLSTRMSNEHAKSIGLEGFSKESLKQESKEYIFANHFYDIDQSNKAYAVKFDSKEPQQDSRDAVRALEILNSRRVIAEPDIAAILLLIQMLCNNFGFNSLHYEEAGQPTEYKLTTPNEIIKSPADAWGKLKNWLNASQGLPTGTAVHLVRPTCLTNLSAVRKPFETLISRETVGWRIPDASCIEFREKTI